MAKALACLVVVVAAVLPSAAFAQCPEITAKRPLFLAGGRYDVPLRETGSVGLLIPLWPLSHGEFGCEVAGYRGLLVEGSVGLGGHRLAVGLARRVKQDDQPALFGEDLLVSVLQTASSPRGASRDARYLGIEVGLTLVAIRFSAGVAHRLGVDGPKATMFVWSIGPQLVW